MKKNIFTRIVAIALVAMSIMAVATTAMASSGTINAVPGTKTVSSAILFTAGSNLSFDVSCNLQSGDIVRVFLDVWNPERSMWVQRDTIKFQTTGYNSGNLSYHLDSNEYKARIRTYGYEANSGTIVVGFTY